MRRIISITLALLMTLAGAGGLIFPLLVAAGWNGLMVIAAGMMLVVGLVWLSDEVPGVHRWLNSATPSDLQIKRFFGRLLHIVGALTAFGFAVTIVIILLSQGLYWLKTGSWSPYPISMALKSLNLHYEWGDWIGLNKLLDWLGDLHVAVVLVPMGIACIFHRWLWREVSGGCRTRYPPQAAGGQMAF